MDFSGLTLARRSIGQATLRTIYERMSVGARNVGVGKTQTWVPGNVARINQEGRRHGGNQCSEEKAEESTHFR
jgi:hypothetical protein